VAMGEEAEHALVAWPVGMMGSAMRRADSQRGGPEQQEDQQTSQP